MGARTGQEYVERLAQTRPTVEINGERVAGPVTEHPALAGVVRSYAELYDLQHDPELRDVLTYESPTSGERVGTSFLVPRDADDLAKRRAGFKAWADHSLGTLGRTGDYLNSALMALSEAGTWFAQADARFGDNIARLLREGARGGSAHHAHADPAAGQPRGRARPAGRRPRARRPRGQRGRQRHRDPRRADAGDDRADRRRAAGVPLDRAQGHAGGRAVLVRVRHQLRRARACASSAARTSTTAATTRSAGRFDEIDAVVVFDDVHVPWERVFMLGHPELCNGFYTDTSAVVHMTHQVTTRARRPRPRPSSG